MPNRDKTGPTGQGPASGWGAGPCGGSQSGYERYGGRGYGRRGRGFGFWGGRRAADSVATPEQERSWLEAQAHNLQDALNKIQERLDALKK